MLQTMAWSFIRCMWLQRNDIAITGARDVDVRLPRLSSSVATFKPFHRRLERMIGSFPSQFTRRTESRGANGRNPCRHLRIRQTSATLPAIITSAARLLPSARVPPIRSAASVRGDCDGNRSDQCAPGRRWKGLKWRRLEESLGRADIYVTCTGNRDVITLEHMQRMKDQAIVCNIGHFDNEIQMARLNAAPGVQKVTIQPQVDKYVFPTGNAIYVLAEGRLVNLGCAHGHPSFVMSKQLYQPGAGPDRPLEEARRLQGGRHAPAQIPRRRSGPPASRKDWGETHEADACNRPTTWE